MISSSSPEDEELEDEEKELKEEEFTEVQRANNSEGFF